MILTLLWKWLRGLWREAHPTPAQEASRPNPEGETALDFRNQSGDADNAGVVIFEGDGPQTAK
jgi:hypothetical protein